MIERTDSMASGRSSAAFPDSSVFDAESIPTATSEPAGSSQGAFLAEGTIVSGKYQLNRLIGTGGMGLVYAASHLALQEVVAIKILRPSMMAVPGMVSRFMREARAASKIKSEHVARVTDVDTLPSGVPYIVMEYLTGTDLSSLRRRSGRLPIAEAVTYIQQACDAIGEAHSLGIVHRDLKPSNLFVVHRRDGKSIVKVLDFGISKVDSPSEQDTTTTGLTMGTPKYMSPEQMRSLRDTDGRTDIWSLGAILYELLAGRPPFAADSVAQVCALVLEGNLPSLRKLRPDVPLALEAVVARCLRKRPSERFSTADELARALEPFTTHEAGDELLLSDEVFDLEPESRTDTAVEELSLMRVSSPEDVTRPTGPMLSRPSRSLPPISTRSTAPSFSTLSMPPSEPPASMPSSAPPTPTLRAPQPSPSASGQAAPALVTTAAPPPELPSRGWRRRVAVALLVGAAATAGAVLSPRETPVRIGVAQPSPVDTVDMAAAGMSVGSGLGFMAPAGDSAVRGTPAVLVTPPVAPAAVVAVPSVEPPTVTPAPSASTIPAEAALPAASASRGASAPQAASASRGASTSQVSAASRSAGASQVANASRNAGVPQVAKTSRVTPGHAPTGARRSAPTTSRRQVVVDPFGGSRK